MISHEYGDRGLVHVSARHNRRDLDAMARLRRALVARGMDFTVFDTNITGPTLHLRFRLPA